MRTLRCTLFSVSAGIFGALLLSGCMNAVSLPQNPDWTIDMSTDRPYLTEPGVAPGETLVIKSAKAGLKTKINGSDYQVYIDEAGLPTGSNVYIGGRNVEVIVNGPIAEGAEITLEGDGGTLTAYGDVAEASTIQLAGEGTTFVKEGFFENILGDSSKYVD